MGTYDNDQILGLWELTKSLTDQAYTRYVNLKQGVVHDSKHLVSTIQCEVLHMD